MGNITNPNKIISVERLNTFKTILFNTIFDSSSNGLAPAASSANKTTAETSVSNYYLCADGKYRQLPANAFRNDKVTQQNTTTTSSYNVLFSLSTSTTADKTEVARKSMNLQFSPSAGRLTSKSFAHTPYTSNSTSGAITIDASNGDLHIITLSGNVSGITISNPVAGQNITVILYSASAERSVTINHTTSSPYYICPNAEALSLTVPAGGYCEVGFLVKSTTEIFVRGV